MVQFSPVHYSCIHTIQIHKKNSLAKEAYGLHEVFSLIQSPVLIMHRLAGDAGEENSLLTGINLQQSQNQAGQPSTWTGWGVKGHKKNLIKHHNTC